MNRPSRRSGFGQMSSGEILKGLNQSYLKGEKVIIEKADVEIDNKVHFKAGKILSKGGGAICRVSAGFNILVIEKLRNEDILKRVPLKEGDYFE